VYPTRRKEVMLFACPRAEETVVIGRIAFACPICGSFLKEYSDEYQRFPAVAETLY
jgi:hypothetical protein